MAAPALRTVASLGPLLVGEKREAWAAAAPRCPSSRWAASSLASGCAHPTTSHHSEACETSFDLPRGHSLSHLRHSAHPFAISCPLVSLVCISSTEPCAPSISTCGIARIYDAAACLRTSTVGDRPPGAEPQRKCGRKAKRKACVSNGATATRRIPARSFLSRIIMSAPGRV